MPKIHVTPDDIKHGQPCDPQRCAFALAVCRELECDSVHVFGKSVEAMGHTYSLPREAQDWLDEFDFDKHRCQPIEFELREPADG